MNLDSLPVMSKNILQLILKIYFCLYEGEVENISKPHYNGMKAKRIALQLPGSQAAKINRVSLALEFMQFFDLVQNKQETREWRLSIRERERWKYEIIKEGVFKGKGDLKFLLAIIKYEAKRLQNQTKLSDKHIALQNDLIKLAEYIKKVNRGTGVNFNIPKPQLSQSYELINPFLDRHNI